MSDHSFSWALAALKQGKRVSRPVWGKGAYVVLQKGYPDGIPMNANTAEATGEPEGTVAVFRPYLMVKLADGTFLPFIPTLDHLLAEDWQEGASKGSGEDIKALRKSAREMAELEAQGVDNWEGYGEAMRRAHEGE